MAILNPEVVMRIVRAIAGFISVATVGCAIGPSWRPFVPPDGGPGYPDAYIWTLGNVVASVSTSFSVSLSDAHNVLGGTLSAGVKDDRWIHWEFVGRRENQDLYYVAIISGEKVLEHTQVLYAGGQDVYRVGTVLVHISDQSPVSASVTEIGVYPPPTW